VAVEKVEVKLAMEAWIPLVSGTAVKALGWNKIWEESMIWSLGYPMTFHRPPSPKLPWEAHGRTKR